MITVETNKDLFIFNTIDGIREITRTKFSNSVIIPKGTKFNVIDILIDRSNKNLGSCGISFLCDNKEFDVTDYINADDIDDKY